MPSSSCLAPAIFWLHELLAGGRGGGCHFCRRCRRNLGSPYGVNHSAACPVEERPRVLDRRSRPGLQMPANHTAVGKVEEKKTKQARTEDGRNRSDGDADNEEEEDLICGTGGRESAGCAAGSRWRGGGAGGRRPRRAEGRVHGGDDRGRCAKKEGGGVVGMLLWRGGREGSRPSSSTWASFGVGMWGRVGGGARTKRRWWFFAGRGGRRRGGGLVVAGGDRARYLRARARVFLSRERRGERERGGGRAGGGARGYPRELCLVFFLDTRGGGPRLPQRRSLRKRAHPPGAPFCLRARAARHRVVQGPGPWP